MLKRLFTIVTVSLLISGCAKNGTKEVSLDGYDELKLSRAKELYACSSFFRIVGSQRKNQEEIDRYNNFTKQAKQLGNDLIKAAGKDPSSLDWRVVNSLYKNGDQQAVQMIISIGKDKSGVKFKETTISCYELVKKEEFFANVGVLNKRLNKEK